MPLTIGTRRALLRRYIDKVLHLTATTAGAGNVTINRLTPTGGSCTIFWGDGGTTEVADGNVAAHVHAYGAAGTWAITVSNPALITQLDLHDPQLGGLDTAELVGSAITYFRCYSLGTACTVRSADMVGWTPTDWRLYGMPAGTYAIDSADMALWTPPHWRLYGMPAGTYAIDSADMALWTPTDWQLATIHAVSLTLVVASANFAGWTTCTAMRADNNGLIQAQVNEILYGMYRASIAPRTVAGGTINIGGTNAAPSGVFQAAAACPVDAATPGKEVAHELLNDGCGAGFNVWATVTITA